MSRKGRPQTRKIKESEGRWGEEEEQEELLDKEEQEEGEWRE
jgi:hypothetical protein